MQTQERETLGTFLQQLAQTQVPSKDAEAQTLIADAFARQPDAAYLVVQRALLLDMACKNAEVQIAQLKSQLAAQQQAPQSAPVSSFLDANSWGRQPVAPVAAMAPARLATPAALPSYASTAVPTTGASTAAAPPARGFQAPSFLTGMATTAAGVAAGAFLFQGINHLVGSNHASGLGGQEGSAKAAETPAGHGLLDAPDNSNAQANNGTAGFDELLDFGGNTENVGDASGDGGGNDWT